MVRSDCLNVVKATTEKQAQRVTAGRPRAHHLREMEDAESKEARDGGAQPWAGLACCLFVRCISCIRCLSVVSGASFASFAGLVVLVVLVC